MSRSLVRRALLAASMGAAALGVASPAPAQDSKAAAEAVFEEGLAAFEAKDYASACPKLEAAVNLTRRESLGGLLLLAECQEARERVATAWTLYREVVAKASRAGQTDRAAKAREGEARLAPRLHRVTIAVDASLARLPGLVVRRGEDAVPPEAFGIGLPTDSGALVVTAEAPGRAPFRKELTIPVEPGTSTVVVTLAEAPAARAAAPPPASPPTASRSATRPGDEPQSTGGRPWLAGGLVLAGIGVVGVGVGIGVGVAAKGSYDDAVACCSGGLCRDPADKAAADDARGTGDAATGIFFAGLGLTAIGATVVAIDLATSGSPARSARLDVLPAGARIRAAF